MCVSTVYTQYLPEFCGKKYHRHITRWDSNPRPMQLYRAVYYQLDYRDCPAANGSSKPMFWQRVLQTIYT